jgi:hypothetical protein
MVRIKEWGNAKCLKLKPVVRASEFSHVYLPVRVRLREFTGTMLACQLFCAFVRESFSWKYVFTIQIMKTAIQ